MTRARLVLVALLVVLVACTPDGGTTPSAGEPASYPRVAGLEAGCPPPDQQPNLPEGPLPTGATQVRLCNLEGDRFFIGKNRKYEQDFDVPVDALIAGADELVEMVNSQTIVDDYSCGGVGSPTMVLWFSYPDADRAVTYNPGGCGRLDRGDGLVLGATEVHHLFSDLLWRQRSAGAPAQAPGRAECQPFGQGDTPLLVDQHFELGSAVVCVTTPTARPRIRTGRLDPAQVALVNRRFTAEPPESRNRCDIERPAYQPVLRGVTTWGDSVALWPTCADLTVPVPYGDDELVWRVPDDVRRMLDDLPLGPPRRNVPYDPAQIRPVE